MTEKSGYVILDFMVNSAPPTWLFLTSYARVLTCIAQDPGVRLREIGETAGITERAAQRIVAELVDAGYVTRERTGRRSRYTIHAPAASQSAISWRSSRETPNRADNHPSNHRRRQRSSDSVRSHPQPVRVRPLRPKRGTVRQGVRHPAVHHRPNRARGRLDRAQRRCRRPAL